MQLNLADYGKTLATRPLASNLRVDFLSDVHDDVTLDFAGVLAVSHSFADELVGELAEAALYAGGDWSIHVINASDEVLAVIERACDRRDASGALRVPHAA